MTDMTLLVLLANVDELLRLAASTQVPKWTRCCELFCGDVVCVVRSGVCSLLFPIALENFLEQIVCFSLQLRVDIYVGEVLDSNLVIINMANVGCQFVLATLNFFYFFFSLPLLSGILWLEHQAVKVKRSRFWDFVVRLGQGWHPSWVNLSCFRHFENERCRIYSCLVSTETRNECYRRWGLSSSSCFAQGKFLSYGRLATCERCCVGTRYLCSCLTERQFNANLTASVVARRLWACSWRGQTFIDTSDNASFCGTRGTM